MTTATTSQIVFGLYDAYFLRAPDQKGFVGWQDAAKGKTPAELQQFLIETSINFYKQDFSQSGKDLDYGSMTDQKFVEAIYANVLAGTGTNTPSAAEVTYWVDFLKKFPTTSEGMATGRGTFVVTFIQAAIEYDVGTDAVAKDRQDTLMNRISVAETWLTTLGAATNVSDAAAADQTLLPSDPAFQASQKIISGVTADDSTMDRAESFIGSIKTSDDPMGAINSATNEQIFGGGGGQDFTLTVNQDIWTGSALEDVVRGVAGLATGSQDQTTLNSSDILDGGDGNDTLVVNMTGLQYLGGATVKNIETLQIGTNLPSTGAVPVAFDINVNQGKYEVTGVETLTYDQITNGETLVVQNIVPVAAGNTTPVMKWANEAGSRAGTIASTYRQESITGTNDNQRVDLVNVDATQGQGTANGTLLVAGGMESMTITSSGTVAQNTLNNIQWQNGGVIAGVTYTDTGVNNVFADVISRGTLTKVVLDGGTDIGRAAGVVTSLTSASYGLTDRVWVASGVGDGDLGLTTLASASNLLSVGSRVVEVDASAMTADTSTRFTAKTDGTATNVTFKGGAGSDYVEFELGNITATGGEGADTFAFINPSSNSAFGSTDTVDGGKGVDTFQIGVNGQAQTYDIGPTEFNNKTSIEVLDLRGQNNNITLSQEFVSKADEKLTVRTDKVVQTSNTNPDNDLTNTPAATLRLEDRTITQLDTTNLDQNTGLIYRGGSGSDRLILDNESFNQFVDLDGGANRGQGAVAAAGDYDTLTVRDGAVVDRGDLANVKGFEGMVLVKTQAAAQYTIQLSEAFLLANTTTNDLNAAYPETNIRDQTFFIGTSNAANANILSAGDVVTVDITDLLTGAGTLKTSLTGRGLDLTSLVAAGVTPNYVVNGAAATAAQIAAVTQNDAVVPRDDVVVNSAAYPRGNLPTILNATGAGFNTTTGFLIQDGKLATIGPDTLNSTAAFLVGSTINLAGGTDTLNITTDAAGVDLSGIVTPGAAADIVNLRAGATGAGFTNANGAGFVVNASAQTTTEVPFDAPAVVNLGTDGQVFNGSTGADFAVGNTGNDSITTGAGADYARDGAGNDTITAGDGNDLVDISTGNDNVSAGAGADVVRVLLSGTDTVDLGAADAAADSVLILNYSPLPNSIDQNNADLVTIRNFEIGADSLTLAAAVSGVSRATSDGVFVNNAVGGVTPPVVTGLAKGTILEISSASYQYAGAPNETAVLAHMTGVMGVTGAANSYITVVVYDGAGNAAIFQSQEKDGTISQFDSIELVGIVEGVGANNLSAANFG